MMRTRTHTRLHTWPHPSGGLTVWVLREAEYSSERAMDSLPTASRIRPGGPVHVLLTDDLADTQSPAVTWPSANRRSKRSAVLIGSFARREMTWMSAGGCRRVDGPWAFAPLPSCDIIAATLLPPTGGSKRIEKPRRSWRRSGRRSTTPPAITPSKAGSYGKGFSQHPWIKDADLSWPVGKRAVFSACMSLANENAAGVADHARNGTSLISWAFRLSVLALSWKPLLGVVPFTIAVMLTVIQAWKSAALAFPLHAAWLVGGAAAARPPVIAFLHMLQPMARLSAGRYQVRSHFLATAVRQGSPSLG